MLVLSRRAQQQIVFPNLGVTLSILQVRGRIVKVGIEAPPEISVLRQEVHSTHLRDQAAENQTDCLMDSDIYAGDSEAEHRRRNQRNVLQLTLDAIQHRIDSGNLSDAKEMTEALVTRMEKDDYRSALPGTTAKQVVAGADRPLRLLVVEDSDNERGLMAYLLASHGFIVQVARDGAEACEQLQRWTTLPDFVLMDMQMPMFNGLEAMCRIREDQRLQNLHIYAVTGSRRDVHAEPVGRGWDRWFAKPLDVRQLVQAIQEDHTSTNLNDVSPVDGGASL